MLRKLRVAELADGGQRYGGHAYQDALATARADGGCDYFCSETSTRRVSARPASVELSATGRVRP